MIFTIENLNMQVLIKKKIAFQQFQGGLYNEFDRYLCEIKLFESTF